MNSPKINPNMIKCDVSDIWKVLGKAWSLLILKNLSTKEAIRFNELKKILPEISNTVLADRLRELEHEKLIIKKIYAQVPLKVEYSLTKDAKDLEIVLEELERWIKKRESITKNKK
ncbi:winged helix-turn-helix transcriptional regulator [Candidatus Nitrosotalea bavarica]|jgi:DNA-binding HxlR family transcriptional regulator|uniref:winged helix-turn-helix transcriptional regulator n=1 Tax=Candidatus Nitrosotalea bavarica TaxID=1903277 RepID=UPI000C705821|nr:helix-turn-helix domain-containing protein [Candidatus Nitrosotalea bavarica]